MDYFAYTAKKTKDSTLVIHDSGKIPCRPTCIRYSAFLFQDQPPVLSASLPSPPITPHVPTILPSLSLPSPSVLRRRFSNPSHTIRSPRLHVLLVDDNSINLQILSRMLSTHMSDVFEHIELVKSGVKALDVLKRRPFDLILMDIDMPILNGVETTRQIRSSSSSSILPHNRDIPIVAVTTNDSDDWRQLYTEVGMNGCISKPILLNDLKSSLSSILDLDLIHSPYTPE
ncbi:hypothetical protein G6F55_012772 [Rhizopus delemar]|uniref:Response regulatory domain-containing protein n=3 Tax=Rhizopus TaxID=4842 RepID=I1BMY1_RHIO9|nr:hypothetical protein RO3G_02265 [Rhizopus delemar RA 99-880]KAG1050633.1 hypothetical protein G6F43_007110 [Rhizopus delemar]KAG1535095.1 hypothetical protein G6F51_011723 [Rhizopus arrhizus]KAG1443092.1 hypothetical protein G6F55_012772 [Rhizopus delemar]KAG1487193.1 hypothetical protein G6F54_012808 [Rhizopus delemar]|eukprot:EIE77561.1 hypothetical protein RO3G_02265 [Rhizopus delemar RA 99-880]